MEATENKKITVVARKKPCSKPGKVGGTAKLSTTSPQRILLKILGREKEYIFDRVFPATSNQFQLYKFIILPLLTHIFDGGHSLVFLYGQSGSGKSHAIVGHFLTPLMFHRGASGLLPKTILHLLAHIKNEELDYHLTVSFIEVHNEKARDLLTAYDPWASEGDRKELNSGNSGFTLKVVDYDEFLSALNDALLDQQKANANRTASEVSTIYTVGIREDIDYGTNVRPIGSIVFVDLAASEHLQNFYEAEIEHGEMTGAKKSLFVLGNVLEALNKNMDEVPYQHSKLTSLLEKPLSSDSKVAFIATVSSDSPSHFKQSGYALDFAEMLQRQQPSDVPQEEIFVDPSIELQVMMMEIKRLRSKFSLEMGVVLNNYVETEDSQSLNVITVFKNLVIFQRECHEVNQKLRTRRFGAAARGAELEIVNINEYIGIIGQFIFAIDVWKKRIKNIADFYEVPFPYMSNPRPETTEKALEGKQQDAKWVSKGKRASSNQTMISKKFLQAPEEPLLSEEGVRSVLKAKRSSSTATMLSENAPKASLLFLEENQQSLRSVLTPKRSSSIANMSSENIASKESPLCVEDNQLRSVLKQRRSSSATVMSSKNTNEDLKKKFEEIELKLLADNGVLCNFLHSFVVHLLETKKLNMLDVEQFVRRYEEK